MLRAILIFNPVSGQRPGRRVAQVEAAGAVLRAAGVEATLAATPAAGCAGQIAAEAIASGTDTVFACGGDGTVHEVLQGMVGREAALGVIPLGTANSLAWDLRVPRNPAAAAKAALSAQPREVNVGQVTYQTPTGPATRWFVMNVGTGMDALLFYRLNALAKRRFGMSAYYAEAFRQWLRARYEYFDCEFVTTAGEVRHERVTQAMAVRIADFGGIVGKLAPGADLSRADLRLLLFKTASRTAYLRYTILTALNRPRNMAGIELVDAVRVRCRLPVGSPACIYTEADGEILGKTPVEVAMTDQKIRLLAGNV